MREFAPSCRVEGLSAYRDLPVMDLFYPAVTGLLLAGLADLVKPVDLGG